MRTLLILAAFTCVIIAASPTDKRKGCIYASSKHQWTVGENYNPPDECVMLKCKGTNQFTVKTCALNYAKGCKFIPQNNSKNFPECCPQWNCDKKN